MSNLVELHHNQDTKGRHRFGMVRIGESWEYRCRRCLGVPLGFLPSVCADPVQR